MGLFVQTEKELQGKEMKAEGRGPCHLYERYERGLGFQKELPGRKRGLNLQNGQECELKTRFVVRALLNNTGGQSSANLER